MPSLNDFYNELTQVNAGLQTLHNDIVALTNETSSVRASVDTGFTRIDATLTAGFTALSDGAAALISLQTYANESLNHNTLQNDTMICSLEQVSRNTCSSLNEEHVQTGLQTAITESVRASLEISKAAHPDAALDLERHEKLRAQIEECCPPPQEPPVCSYEQCKAPPRRPGKPPHVDFEPFRPPPQE